MIWIAGVNVSSGRLPEFRHSRIVTAKGPVDPSADSQLMQSHSNSHRPPLMNRSLDIISPVASRRIDYQ